jgi:hypothetical protein
MNFTACPAGLSGVLTAQKKSKKACQGIGVSARGTPSDKCPRFVVQKKFKKVKKKLVRALEI